MIVWKLIFTIDYSRNISKEMILYLSLLSFMCEGVKFGLFFNTEPCSSQLWEQNNTVGEYMVGAIERFEADQCFFDRSAYASLGAFACYLFLIIYLTAALVNPDYTHRIIRQQRTGGAGLDYDNVSMPSYLGSIGQSETSHSTRSLGTLNTADSAKSPQSSLEQQMTPIKEEEGSCGSYRSYSSYKSSPDSRTNMYEISIDSSDDDSSGYEDYTDRSGYR